MKKKNDDVMGSDPDGICRIYTQKEVTEGGTCVGCGAECDAEDYCYGCKSYVCDACDDDCPPKPGHSTPSGHTRINSGN